MIRTARRFLRKTVTPPTPRSVRKLQRRIVKPSMKRSAKKFPKSSVKMSKYVCWSSKFGKLSFFSFCRCVRPHMNRNVNHPTIMARHVRTFPSKSVNIRRNVTLSTVSLVKMSLNNNVQPPMNNIARSVTESFPISWFNSFTVKTLGLMKLIWFWFLTLGYSKRALFHNIWTKVHICAKGTM